MKKKKRRLVSKKLLLVSMALLVLMLLGGIVINHYSSLQADQADRARFAEVRQKKAAIAAQLAESLGGNVISAYEKNVCFNTEQGPWDNGRLWCQTAAIVELRHDINYSDVGDDYLRIGRSAGLRVSSVSESLFPSYTIRIGGIDCELESLSSNGDSDGSAMYIPFNDRDYIAVAVACADRARAAYYPYVE